MFLCNNCGYRSAKWLGRCPQCGEWSSFSEVTEERHDKKGSVRDVVELPVSLPGEEFLHLTDEFDRFFGSGVVKGGVYLVSGAPGVGKSTLLLEFAKMLMRSGYSCVYVSAEESLSQVSTRVRRLGCEGVHAVGEAGVEGTVELIRSRRFDCVVVDSIHALRSLGVDSHAGSLSQVRYCSERIASAAKESGTTVFIVAHVTKEGVVAGPKTLEHLVDCVVYLEVARDGYRFLRSTKNRFGPTDEAIVLDMSERGLDVISNPTLSFVDEKQDTDGSVYGIMMEGNLPIVVEVQALCVPTAFGMPRRTAVGFDLNRLNVIVAVLEKRLSLPMYKFDVYLNIVGGMRVATTLVDAAVAGSVLSSVEGIAVPADVVLAGEIDLSGRIRAVGGLKRVVHKVEEAGFRVYSPEKGLRFLADLKKIVQASSSSL